MGTRRRPVDEHRTLEEIERDRWGAAPSGSTSLVQRVHALRRVPVRDLDVEGLRMLIGQQVGLPPLMPRALAVLAANPLAEGDLYPGDLLSSVMKVGHEYWDAHPEQHAVAVAIVRRVRLDEDGGVTGQTV
jgi:hypothetical protein